jgi:hypothetical protein
MWIKHNEIAREKKNEKGKGKGTGKRNREIKIRAYTNAGTNAARSPVASAKHHSLLAPVAPPPPTPKSTSFASRIYTRTSHLAIGDESTAAFWVGSGAYVGK